MKMNQITSGSIRYTWHYCMSVHSATEIPLLLLCLLCSLLQLVVEEPIVFLGIIIIRFLAMTCIVNLGIIFRAWADWKSGESHCFPKNYYYFSTSKCIVGPFLYSKTQQIWQSHQKWKKVRVQRNVYRVWGDFCPISTVDLKFGTHVILVMLHKKVMLCIMHLTRFSGIWNFVKNTNWLLPDADSLGIIIGSIPFQNVINFFDISLCLVVMD